MKKLTIAAIAVTILWGIAGGTMIWIQKESPLKLPLNEIGDFLAGFFSPVAFLWLVVGYFQQSEGLRINTEALRAQIEELQLSVKQQRELVDITRHDVAVNKQALELEVARQERMAQPNFLLSVGRCDYHIEGVRSFDATLSNDGHTATLLDIDCSKGEVVPSTFAALSATTMCEFTVILDVPSWSFVVTIDYNDGLGKSKAKCFQSFRDKDGTLTILPSTASTHI
jgi:hypothetical protein